MRNIKSVEKITEDVKKEQDWQEYLKILEDEKKKPKFLKEGD